MVLQVVPLIKALVSLLVCKTSLAGLAWQEPELAAVLAENSVDLRPQQQVP